MEEQIRLTDLIGKDINSHNDYDEIKRILIQENKRILKEEILTEQ